MSDKELYDKLEQLLHFRTENEVTEFKKAENTYDFTKLGKYFLL